VPVLEVRFRGADEARPARGVIDAIATAEQVVVAPSNPIVSIGPILAVPGVRPALEARRAATVAVSPIVGGRALKGPADRLLRELGLESSVIGVARLYTPFAHALVVDERDAELADAVAAEGMACVVTRTIMTDPAAAADLARTVLEVAAG
jgi:LPPG:FO 2-phospho-L-lactate transferase